jgi:V-type H+-transporting ATPase subunit E
MSSSNALSDDQVRSPLPCHNARSLIIQVSWSLSLTTLAQVASELKKMTAFIRQEALEKAREIHLKADEEFAIEKSKLVREETSSIDTEYEKKFKQASMSQQITRSTMSNKTRLKVLSARQDLLDQLFEKARSQLGEQSKKKEYDAMLKDLILEGMYLMSERKVGLRCRKGDKDKVESAAKKASEEYKKNMGHECQTKVDEKNWIPDESYVSHLICERL